jgi:hypothetical protein
MSKTLRIGVFAASAALIVIDFSKQTFNGMPTPMDPISVPVQFTTQCDVTGCVPVWDNGADHARNPAAPWFSRTDGIATVGKRAVSIPTFAIATTPSSAVKATRSDYLIPNPDGSFFGERTLTIDVAGCPGEGPGTHWLPISLTPVDPPR